jgi:hypothetical protein
LKVSRGWCIWARRDRALLNLACNFNCLWSYDKKGVPRTYFITPIPPPP